MKKNITKLFLIIISIFIISIFLIIYLNKKVVPIYLNYSESEMKRVVTTVINKTVSELEFNDDLFILKNSDNIKIVDYNPKVLNNIISIISNNVYSNLKLIEKMDKNTLKKFNLNSSIFYIPSGIVFNSVMLNNIGPKIPVKLEIIESINPNIETKVTEYGINNSLIEVNIRVNANIRMVLPLSSRNIEITVIVPLTVKIIQGNIPEYYFGDLRKNN